jgi:hypothetical protein
MSKTEEEYESHKLSEVFVSYLYQLYETDYGIVPLTTALTSYLGDPEIDYSQLKPLKNQTTNFLVTLSSIFENGYIKSENGETVAKATQDEADLAILKASIGYNKMLEKKVLTALYSSGEMYMGDVYNTQKNELYVRTFRNELIIANYFKLAATVMGINRILSDAKKSGNALAFNDKPKLSAEWENGQSIGQLWDLCRRTFVCITEDETFKELYSEGDFQSSAEYQLVQYLFTLPDPFPDRPDTHKNDN